MIWSFVLMTERFLNSAGVVCYMDMETNFGGKIIFKTLTRRSCLKNVYTNGNISDLITQVTINTRFRTFREHSERILSDQRIYKLIPLSKKILCYIEKKCVDDISS